MTATAVSTGLSRHLRETRAALDALQTRTPVLERWGRHLARSLPAGGRLLVAGNGGSAAEAQHLTAELVGRYRDERQPLSALALHAETSTVTAVANDYGFDDAFARQVRAHGRLGDILLCLSTSGRSPNLLAAVDAADRTGLHTWALTGPAPNPLADRTSEAVAIEGPTTASVQEAHLVAVHLLCEVVDTHLVTATATGADVGTRVGAHAGASS